MRHNMKLLDPSKYYFYCCAGLGDTMLFCMVLHKLEEKYSGEIVPVVKASHEVIMQMYEIGDYLVLKKDVSLKQLKRFSSITPQKGYIYCNHPCQGHPELKKYFEPIYYNTSTIHFLDWYMNFLGVKDFEIVKPKKYPKLREPFKTNVLKYNELDKIVLFSPEATSVAPLPDYFWEELCDEYKKKGYTVISNVVDESKKVPGSVYIDMTSEEAVALAMSCREVCTIRSGFADLIYEKGRHLHVYYSNHSAFYEYEMQTMYGDFGIEEKLVFDERVWRN